MSGCRAETLLEARVARLIRCGACRYSFGVPVDDARHISRHGRLELEVIGPRFQIGQFRVFLLLGKCRLFPLKSLPLGADELAEVAHEWAGSIGRLQGRHRNRVRFRCLVFHGVSGPRCCNSAGTGIVCRQHVLRNRSCRAAEQPDSPFAPF